MPIFAAAGAAVALGAWMMLAGQSNGFDVRVPVPEPRISATQEAIDLSGKFVKGPGEPSKLPGLWPWFRGPDFDGISKDKTKLLKQFGASDPKVLWSLDIGQGYAGAVVRNGRVYLLDYGAIGEPKPDGRKPVQGDILRCLSLDDGREIWRRAYPVQVAISHGMSRTVPAATDKYVVSLGPKCHVLCVDAVTGDYKWGKDLVREYGASVPEWYAGQCPLIDGDKVILAPGGKEVMMTALDLADGHVLWEVPNTLEHWRMTHVSVVPMTFKGKRMYVWCGDRPAPKEPGDLPEGGVVIGVDEKGAVLWKTTVWHVATATVASPTQVGDGLIFLSGGYGRGSMMLQLSESADGTITAAPLFDHKPEVFGSVQQTPIFYKGYIYGVAPDEQLVCLDLNGNRVWASGRGTKFGLGPYTIADDTLYLLNDVGVLTAVQPTPAGYRPFGSTTLFTKGREAWGPLTIVGGRLIARDLTRMICVDLEQH